MWKCEKCGSTFEGSGKQCWACGTSRPDQKRETKSSSAGTLSAEEKINKICPKCGRKYDSSWGVCLTCGKTLSNDLNIKPTNPELSNLKRTKVSHMLLGIFVGVILYGIGSVLKDVLQYYILSLNRSPGSEDLETLLLLLAFIPAVLSVLGYSYVMKFLLLKNIRENKKMLKNE